MIGSILINAYAVSPNWGSEQGVGWNWVINIAKYCNVHVITEGEWRDDIEKALSLLEQKNNIHFYYLPVSERVRRMCWNQGDWRFYFHYHRWQIAALKLARKICCDNKIDIIHQLNMVGFREPGLLWKIKNIPFVLGPIAGRNYVDIRYFSSRSRYKYFLKNILNYIQFNFSPRVILAFKKASAVITPMKDMAEDILTKYNCPVYLIPETGLDFQIFTPTPRNDGYLNLLWVGRFVESKQLALALSAIAHLKNKEKVRFHIIGFGMNNEDAYYRTIADRLGISEYCIWMGKLENNDTKLIMRQMDAFFFTSIDEVTSTVVPEAIQAGLPIICHDICGFGPIVNEKIGWTIPLESPKQSIEGFASIIDSLCENPQILKKNIDDFNNVARKLTYQSHAAEVINIYKELIVNR